MYMTLCTGRVCGADYSDEESDDKNDDNSSDGSSTFNEDEEVRYQLTAYS